VGLYYAKERGKKNRKVDKMSHPNGGLDGEDQGEDPHSGARTKGPTMPELQHNKEGGEFESVSHQKERKSKE